jgi:hypothetical protein
MQFASMAYAKALQADLPSPLEKAQKSETLTIHGATHATKEPLGYITMGWLSCTMKTTSWRMQAQTAVYQTARPAFRLDSLGSDKYSDNTFIAVVGLPNQRCTAQAWL